MQREYRGREYIPRIIGFDSIRFDILSFDPSLAENGTGYEGLYRIWIFTKSVPTPIFLCKTSILLVPIISCFALNVNEFCLAACCDF